MNKVTFPSINLELEISRVAFTVFGIKIYWYAIIMISAIILGILLLRKRDGLYNIKFSDIIDLLIFLIPISIISARIYYVLFNLEHYLANPSQIFNIRNGGLAIYGGIIGGAITCIVFCKKRKIDLINLLDIIAPALILGQAIGRWGNFVNIEAYGTETTLPWRMGIIEAGKYLEVHPTFLYESIANFIIFCIIVRIKENRKFKGQVACTYFILYSAIRFFIEGLRTDSLMFGSIRISQALSLVIFVIVTIIYTKLIIKSKNEE